MISSSSLSAPASSPFLFCNKTQFGITSKNVCVQTNPYNKTEWMNDLNEEKYTHDAMVRKFMIIYDLLMC